MFIASTYNGHVGYFSGRFWRFDERIAEVGTDQATVNARCISLPYGVSVLDRRLSVCQYADRLYVVGAHTANLVIDEHERAWVQGIMPPLKAPSVTSGGTGTDVLCYLSFWDELTDEHSPLSAHTAVAETPPYVWTDLPTHTPDEYMYPSGYVHVEDFQAYASNVYGYLDTTAKVPLLRPGDKIYDTSTGKAVALLRAPTDFDKFSTLTYQNGIYEQAGALPQQRASHVILWRSVAGALPRVVTKVRLGTGSVTESVPYTQLGEIHPGNFSRFPRCTINTIYHDRQLLAGNPLALDTVYMSAIGYPERNEGFQFRTRGGDAVTALIGTRDYCLILTATCTYLLQGYTEDDMSVDLVDNGIGALGHTINTVVNGYPYVTSRTGVHMYNGSWHPVMKDSAHTFAEHVSKLVPIQISDTTYVTTNAAFYQNGWLVNNQVDKTLQLFMGKGMGTGLGGVDPDLAPTWFGQGSSSSEIPGLYAWVLGYEPVVPQAGGSYEQADLSHDFLMRFRIGPFSFTSSTAAEFLVTDDGGAGTLWFGTEHGYLYREMIGTISAGIIMTPAYFFDSAGGYEREGKTLVKFWSFLDSPDAPWSVVVSAGDEWAGIAATAAPGLAGGGPTHSGRFMPEYDETLRMWNFAGQSPDPEYPWFITPTQYTQYADNVPASQPLIPAIPDGKESIAFNYYSPKSVHEHPLPEAVSGRMFTWTYYFNGVWRGFGGYYQPGPAGRPMYTATNTIS